MALLLTGVRIATHGAIYLMIIHMTSFTNEVFGDGKYTKLNYLSCLGHEVSLEVKPVEYFQSGKGPHLLNIGARFPDQSLTLVIWENILNKNFPKGFHPRNLLSTNIKVTGKISEYKGRPQIVIFGPDQLTGDWSQLTASQNNEPSKTVDLLLNSPIGAECTTSTNSVIGEALLQLIDTTEKTLDMAVYGFRKQPQIYNALARAKQRGVSIRLVTDRTIDGKNYYSSTKEFEALIGNVKTDLKTDLRTMNMKKNHFESFWPSPDGFEGPPQSVAYSIDRDRAIIAVHASRAPFQFQGDIMHNKFVISDQQRVWTGSCNISDSGTGGYNANIACIINSAKIAIQFTEEFERMYEEGLFHSQKYSDRYNRQAMQFMDKKSLYIGFCPQDDVVQDSLIPAIQEAEERIDVAMFFLTHKYIAAELIKAHLRGVKVRIIIDATSASNGYTKHKILREVGIPVKVENWGGKMHMKAACIDGQKLILGSMNWTSAGERQNDENYLLLESELDGQRFSRFFTTLWDSIPDICLVHDPDPESLASPGSTTDGLDNDFDNLVDDKDPGATELLYNSKPTPPHGFASKSSGFGTINSKEFPLIIGVLQETKNEKKKRYVLPNHLNYFDLRERAEEFFLTVHEAKRAGFEEPYVK